MLFTSHTRVVLRATKTGKLIKEIRHNSTTKYACQISQSHSQ